ncbi:adenylate/guanylate cyclase domain-containing protein [Treponema sp. OMZ 840]|uniref:adenylate/guanylate cyclase domain-containing protein n=1 Tax=Treponema sp. OMZ 840 TaxID=244313 RepID=UPI003D8C3BFA
MSVIFEKIRKMKKKVIASSYPFKVLSLVVFTVLMFFPFSMDKMDLFNREQPSVLLYPFTVLFSGIIERGFNFLYISCFLLFLIPAAFITICVSFFQKKITGKIIYLCALFPTTFYLSTSIAGMVLFANTPRWFYSLSPLVYSAFFTASIFHFFLIALGIISIKSQSSSYLEYKQLLKEEEKKENAARIKIIEKYKKRKNAERSLKEKILTVKTLLKSIIRFFKHTPKKTYIKIKVTIVILFTILVILSTFIYTDLKNYKTLLTQTVNNTGTNLAEQVAAIYVFSDGLHSKISAFFEGIKKTNASSPFPFERVDIITTNSKTPLFIEKIDFFTEFPLFDVFSYTTAAGHVRTIPADEKFISPGTAALYIEHWQNKQTENIPLYNPEKGTYLYLRPVLFSRKDGQRLVGFSVVTYMKEILDRPYFQAKVFIFSLSAVFFYASIIITLFLADFIANPILFLCGNIRKTANTLGDMLAGSAKIDADKLVFEETVNTRDEIKNLSVEIKNIVSLVRGMLPYVSFQTVQNAEKKISRPSTTRDLCFLFTDIRGFTNLCETMPPKEVIRLLNRYLDIETKIIFDNGGDVDKYVGDEIMAVFSGPKKEINACKAAMEIRKAMQREKQIALKEGDTAISIGIGINSGSVVFGSVGSETRKDLTSIGDTVNLAARLESANKEYGSKSIISEAVYESLNNLFVCRELDFITVKGKTEPVRIFEILQAKDSAAEKIYEIKRLFETGLSYYRKRKWKQAEKYFSEAAEKYNDAPSKVFLKRVARYQENPPRPGWKGVFVMSVK